jgi:large subunit ribosomal protein L24
MKIHKGDKVIVTKGKDRNEIANVIGIVPEAKKILVEGVNQVKKHVRPRKQGQKGQRVEIEMPFDVSNVMLVCPKCNKGTRVGYKYIKETADKKKVGNKTEDDKKINKVRYCKKCQQEI